MQCLYLNVFLTAATATTLTPFNSAMNGDCFIRTRTTCSIIIPFTSIADDVQHWTWKKRIESCLIDISLYYIEYTQITTNLLFWHCKPHRRYSPCFSLRPRSLRNSNRGCGRMVNFIVPCNCSRYQRHIYCNYWGRSSYRYPVYTAVG